MKTNLMYIACFLFAMTVLIISIDNVSALTWDNTAYYKLDETSGTVIDATGNGYNGTNVGATTVVTGIINTAYNFDGNNDYILSNSNTSFAGTSISVNVWVNIDSADDGDTVIDIGPSGNRLMRIFSNELALGKWGLSVDGVGNLISNTSSSTDFGSWVMITGTYDGTNLIIYRNGVSIGSKSGTSTGINGKISIGINSEGAGSYAHHGEIDEIGIWERELSSSEILELYNNGSGLAYQSSIGPEITLESPINGTTISDIGTNFTISGNNISSISGLWKNITFTIWNNDSSIHNQTVVDFSDNQTFNETLFIDEFVLGDYIWNGYACYTNSSGDYCLWAENNYTFTVFPFSVQNVSYTDQVYESSYENINITVSTFPTIQSLSAILHYDGEEYSSSVSCASGLCTIINKFDIPLVPTGSSLNNSFYWTVSVFDGTVQQDYNSSTYQQNVSRIYFEVCGTFTNKTLEFSAAREDNLSSIGSFNFEGSFDYWLGSGNIYRTYSYSNSTASTLDFCISPPEKTYYIESLINFDAAGFTKRTYRLNNYSIDNSSEMITLLLEETSGLTTFVQEVLDGKDGVPDAYIYTYRYYPGTNTWNLTQVTKTDEDGKTSAFYVAETVLYRHTIVINGVTRIQEINGRKMLLESVPYTITWDLTSDIDVPWEIFDDEAGISKSLTFNKNTNIVTFSYTGNSSFSNGKLLVWKEYYSQDDTIICTSTSDLSVATITCDLGDYTGNFIAEGFIEYNGESIIIERIRFSIGRGSDTFGKDGLFLMFFVMMVAGTAFLVSPIIGIVAENVVILLLNIIGIVTFPWTYVFAIMAVSGVLIWLMKD